MLMVFLHLLLGVIILALVCLPLAAIVIGFYCLINAIAVAEGGGDG